MVNRRPVPTKNASKEMPEKVQIDFSDKNARSEFIRQRLDSIFSDVSENYGSFLAGELQKRLEYTIRVFHEDISELLREMAQANDLEVQMNDELRTGKTLNDLVPGRTVQKKQVVEEKPAVEPEPEHLAAMETETADDENKSSLFVAKSKSASGD